MQHTLKTSFVIEGKGLHSGQLVVGVVEPAPVDTGIVFRIVDQGGEVVAEIPALYKYFTETPLCTRLAHPDKPEHSIQTIEHLMSAFAGCGVDNAIISIQGSEVPLLDGSAQPFVEKIDQAGLVQQHSPRRAIEVLRKVELIEDGKYAALIPSPHMSYNFEIEFDDEVIGRQDCVYNHVSSESYRSKIASARTFTSLSVIEYLRSQNLIQGGDLDNAIVVDGSKVLNEGGLRFKDEFVRHKILDAMGDLALAGGPVRGAFICRRGGHGLTNRLLHKLFEDEANWQAVPDYIGLEDTGSLPDLRTPVSAQSQPKQKTF